MSKAERTTVVPSESLKAAAAVLSRCSMNIFALDNVGRKFAGNPFTPLTMSHVVEALCSEVRGTLSAADALLPGRLVHPASIEIGVASDSLEGLSQFMVIATNDDQLALSEKTVGAVIFDLTVRAAKCIERAELACGEMATTNYLSGPDYDPFSVATSAEVAHG